MIDSLKKENIILSADSKNKADLIKEISSIASKSPALSSVGTDMLENSLLQREELSSTGLTDGIAIPHCALDGIEEFTVGLLIHKTGIDFDSIDGKLSHFFFFIIGPSSRRNKHIKILSSISKISKDTALMKALRKVDTGAEAYSLLKIDETESSPVKVREKCQFNIHVQKEELFYDVLEVLSSEVEGALSVIDASTAGSYLHRLPLFSTFWNEKVSHFSKMIIAVVDKPLMNDTIRRLNMVLPDNKEGIIISVTDLVYHDGSIDF